MKQFSPILTLLFLTVIFLMLGFYSIDKFYEFALPNVDAVHYEMQLGKVKDEQYIYPLTIGLVPFFTFLTCQFSRIDDMNKRILAFLIIVISMVVTVIVRRKMLESYLSSLTETFSNRTAGSHVLYPFDQLNLEYYLFGGLCFGCILSYIFLGTKRSYRMPGNL